jgi:uncharacterized protein YuzE
MKITYYEGEDTLFIQFRDQPITRDEVHGDNIYVGFCKEGIREVTIAFAKEGGFWPLYIEVVPPDPEMMKALGR